jgi:light-harvesting complex I chlorophyll a/b binding protein 1
MNGISGPFGYFDPLSLAAGTSPAQVKRYREAELTHGRVCMLAAVGVFAGEAVEKKNMLLNYDGHITGPAIVHFQQVRLSPSVCEVVVLYANWTDYKWCYFEDGCAGDGCAVAAPAE